MARLRDYYKSEVVSALQTKYNYKSVMQIPKLDKIVINVGCGDAKENSKVIDAVINDLTLIAGQKAVPTYAKKSVANFKLREGMKIGAKVTLRGEKMYEFMDRPAVLSPSTGKSFLASQYSPLALAAIPVLPTTSSIRTLLSF